jgi:hypothetical protein
MKVISFKVHENYHEQLAKMGKNANWTASRAVMSWVKLKQYALQELKGIFTKEELGGILNRMDNLIFDPSVLVSKEIFIQGLKEDCLLENKDWQYGYNLQQISAKLQKLTSTQIFFLSEWASTFWATCQNPIEQDEYIAQLV